jgi:hypothetical protein
MSTTLRTAFLIASLAVLPAAHAQKATEQFIPIGRSPDASGKLTTIGEIVAADARERTLTILEPAGPRTVKVPENAPIFLDRSKLKRTNLRGTFADLQTGRRAEVKYQDAKLKQAADWVKVEVDQP